MKANTTTSGIKNLLRFVEARVSSVLLSLGLPANKRFLGMCCLYLVGHPVGVHKETAAAETEATPSSDASETRTPAVNDASVCFYPKHAEHELKETIDTFKKRHFIFDQFEEEEKKKKEKSYNGDLADVKDMHLELWDVEQTHHTNQAEAWLSFLDDLHHVLDDFPFKLHLFSSNHEDQTIIDRFIATKSNLPPLLVNESEDEEDNAEGEETRTEGHEEEKEVEEGEEDANSNVSIFIF